MYPVWYTRLGDPLVPYNPSAARPPLPSGVPLRIHAARSQNTGKDPLQLGWCPPQVWDHPKSRLRPPQARRCPIPWDRGSPQRANPIILSPKPSLSPVSYSKVLCPKSISEHQSGLGPPQIQPGITPNSSWDLPKSGLRPSQIQAGTTPNLGWDHPKFQLGPPQIWAQTTPNPSWDHPKSGLG